MKEIRKPDENIVRILPKVSLLSDTQYIPSQFSLPFFHEGKKYIFNTLTKQCLEAECPLSTFAGEDYDELIKSHFLVPAGTDECSYYQSLSAIMRAFYRKRGPSLFTILPTLGCNARCIYCYEEGMKQATMTTEIVEQTIHYILENRQNNNVRLDWFGGEPLLCFDIIDKICKGLRDASVEYQSSMVSNGSLITPEIIRKMIDDWHLNKIQISMDGAEVDYIVRKRYNMYKDYYHTVIKAISQMSEFGIRVSVRCNVDLENWERIPEFVDDLGRDISNKENVSLHFSPLFKTRSGRFDYEIWSKIADADRLIREAGLAKTGTTGSDSGFVVNHCLADGGGVVITPDGSLYPCEHFPEETRCGDIWNGITNEVARKEFCRVDKVREKCRKCPFLPECTAFATCPVQDRYCLEVHKLLTMKYLKNLVEHAVNEEHSENENRIDC